MKFIDRLTLIIQELKSDQSIIYLGGDVNLDLLKHDKVRNVTFYLDLLLSYNLIPTITKPTKFSALSYSLLDHIFTNYQLINSKSHIIVTDISDHFPVLLINEIMLCKREDPQDMIRIFSPFNIENFTKDVQNTDWKTVSNLTETQEAYTQFHSLLQSCFERNFPRKQQQSRYKKKLPWINYELERKISIKNKLYRKYKLNLLKLT